MVKITSISPHGIICLGFTRIHAVIDNPTRKTKFLLTLYLSLSLERRERDTARLLFVHAFVSLLSAPSSMATNESRRRKVHRFRSLALFLSIMGSIGLIWGDLFVIQVDRGLRGISEHRSLGIYHANNNTCDFEPTLAPDFIPDDSFTNTIIVGYPGGDKRTVLRQMEAMTTLSGRDAWDFQFLGMTRQPFIKTNYPHHEGIWGFQDHGDQVILVVRNLRRTIDEYHDILSDIDYAKTWQEATDKIPMLYHGSVVNEDLAAWRDERVMDEIGWYGW